LEYIVKSISSQGRESRWLEASDGGEQSSLGKGFIILIPILLLFFGFVFLASGFGWIPLFSLAF